MRRLFLLLCVSAVLTIGLSGCGGSSNIKDAPYQDIPLEDMAGNDLSDAGAEQLYQAGHEYLVAGNAKSALRFYSQVQTQFPFTRYATQAALETATAFYMLEKYSKAVAAADRFIKQHPRHPNVDYLYYLRGLANYHHNDAGLFSGNTDQRDLSYLRQAFSDFTLLLRSFPNSVYAADARMHMIEIRNRLADFELTVAEYYLTRNAYAAAAGRASYVLRHYQRSTATPRALEIMQEAYIKLGLPALARDARAILQASYPQYILHRAEFYSEERKENSNGVREESPNESGGLLAWLWPWSDSGEGEEQASQAGPEADNDAGDGWLQGKPNALIGGPDLTNDSPEPVQKTNTDSQANAG